MTDLDTLGGSASYASAINDNGQVVGISMTITGAYHAFLYNGSTMQDLNSLISPGSGWILNTAYSINNLGDIVGAGTYNNNYGNRSRVKVAKLAGKRYFSPFGSCFSRFLHLLNSSYHIISLIFRNL